MNSALKNRLVGAAVLVAVGILIPLVLVWWSQSDGVLGSSDVRVYKINDQGRVVPLKSAGRDGQMRAASPSASPVNREDPEQRKHATKPVIPAPQNRGVAAKPVIVPPSTGGSESETKEVVSKPASAPDQRGRSEAVAESEPSQEPGPESAQEPESESAAEPEPAESPAPPTTPAVASNEAGSSPATRQSEKTGAGAPANAGSWVVQIGSFSKAANAQELKSRVAEAHSVFITTALVSGTRYHRVRVGPFASEKAATRAAQQLRKAGYPTQVQSTE